MNKTLVLENTALGAEVAGAIERIRARVALHSGNHVELQQAVVELQRLALSPLWATPEIRAAAPGEELLYEVAVTRGAPSLYLVSDGVGVVSSAHTHQTWAVIAGIRGQELNLLFGVISTAEKSVGPPSESVIVGVGQTLSLGKECIHATEVLGSEATFHLHLYGQPLCELPSFESRRYFTRS